MKHHIMTIAMLLLLLALGLPAIADELKGGTMSVDIPGQWSGVYEPVNKQFQITAPDESYFLAVQVVNNNGKSAQEFAQLMTKELNGTKPKKMGGEHYSISANVSGMDTDVAIRNAGPKTLVYMEIGDPQKFAKDIKKINKSLKSSDPEEQAAFDLLKE